MSKSKHRHYHVWVSGNEYLSHKQCRCGHDIYVSKEREIKESDYLMLFYKEAAYHNGKLKTWKVIAEAHIIFGASPIGYFPFLRHQFSWENEGIVQQLTTMELDLV